MTDGARLYKYNTSEHEFFDMVPGYKQNYLASNVDYIDPRDGKRVPFAQRYRKFTTKKHGIRVLAFGFLLNFFMNENNTIVQPVEDTIKEQWFQDAIRDHEVDLFVVIGHVGVRQSETENLFKAIRDVQWDAPIIFFGGHVHIRDYRKFDAKAYGLGSGRYMETIGFQSISGLPSRGEQNGTLSAKLASPGFARSYIDNNLFSFQHHTGLNSTSFPTDHGKNISSMIHRARRELDLDKRFGCAPQDYWMTRTPYPHKDSIFTWLDSQVVPEMVVDPKRADKSRIVIGNTGSMRFDIFEGRFTKDTAYIVSPFNSGFRYIPKVPFRIAERLVEVLNNADHFLDQSLPELGGIQRLLPPESIAQSPASTSSPPVQPPYLEPNIQFPLSSSTNNINSKPDLTPGYTTTDDAGSSGDDTIHSPITFYKIPPCFESRVNIEDNIDPEDDVDVIYLEFIQPWVLEAITFLGGEYEDKDTAPYLAAENFTGLITQWVEEHWTGDC